MKVEDFVSVLQTDFYTGVPDSLLRPLNDYLIEIFGENPQRHVIAANEGNAAAIAAGYHLATGKIPAVYLQNSGEGNIVNPFTSLLCPEVCGIPVIFIIGWRGEPGRVDETQHKFQGKITASLLDTLEIPYIILDKHLSADDFAHKWVDMQEKLTQGTPVGIIVRKGSLEYGWKLVYKNNEVLCREEILDAILQAAKEDIFVSTTGKASREIFELRVKRQEAHNHDFLNVGAMGHSSSIALGIALQCPNKRVWCIDGDGAALMHFGAWAVIGKVKPANLVHILINNGAHESVGGVPTAAEQVDFAAIAQACGYKWFRSIADKRNLLASLQELQMVHGLAMLEVKCAIGSRSDLGRPTLTPLQIKQEFMKYVSKE